MPRSLSKPLSKPPTASSTTASPLSRLLRVLFTIYLFAALIYTAYHFLIEPIFDGLFHSRSNLPPSLTARPTGRLGAGLSPYSSHSHAHPNDASGAAEKIAQLEDNLAKAGSGVGAGKKPKKGKLGAVDISSEDKGEALWGNAAAAEGKRKGAKGKGGPGSGGTPKLSSPDAVLHRNFPWVGYGTDSRVIHTGIDPSERTGDVLHWYGVGGGIEEVGGGGRQAIPMAEDFFLSKVFGETLQPSKVVPYYYRASGIRETEDITITTLVTSNRFEVFAELVERYQGPVSATIHVTDDPLARSELLSSLHDLYTSSPSMSLYVDIHLIIDPFDRQFNMWRNVARFFARTAYIMMLDVDFWICTDFRSRLLSSPEIMAKLREGSAAFVVPAFEYTRQADGVDPGTFPKDKEALLELVREEKIGMFHKSWQPGHGSTNYTRYYEARKGEVYRARTYNHAYEPYVIFKKEGPPYCDERFVGYGANKAAALHELYLSGVSFYILPDDFLIHRSHAYAETARKHERKYNRKLYADFREELCFRYLRAFMERIDDPRSKNLLLECKKIKGFTGTASKLIAAHTSG